MAASGGGRLVIVKRDGSEGSSYPLLTGSLTIGSSKDCDIILTSKGFPLKQCTITVHPTEARLKNFANNTTVVNSASVVSKSLQHRDLITLGTAKFRWEYANKTNSSKKNNIRRPAIVKRTRNNISRRKSEPAVKKHSFTVETKGRSSLEPQSRQIAIVKPQTRCLPTVSNTNGLIQYKNKMDGKLNESDLNAPPSSAKKKKVEKVEKFDSPVVLDKNKRAALLLLTKRTPLLVSPSQINLSKTTPKFKPNRNITSSSVKLQTIAKVGSIKSANVSKTPKVSNLARQTIINQSKKRISLPIKSKAAVCTPDLKNKCNTELKSKLFSAGINSHHKKRETLRSSSSVNNEKQLTPSLKLNKTRRSLALKTPTPSKAENTPLKNSKATPKSTNNSVSVEKSDNNSPYMSFLSSLTNALNIMNNSEIDLEAIRKTPEFRAISNKIKFVEKSIPTKSPSPKILEIGRISRSSKRMIPNENVVHNNFTSPSNAVLNSPIISPKHASPEIFDSTLNCIDINTPNLSQVFDVKSSTPMDILNSKQKNTPVKNPRRSMQLFQSASKNSKSFKAKSKTEPNKKFKVKINFNYPVPQFNLNVSNKSSNTEVSEPNINVTPKSTLKPPPEILKEKHSTAKKPVSKRSIIDHLTRSPEIAKELFKSPVKRILSESMKHYDSYISDDNSASNQDSIVKDSSFELLTRSKRLSNISHEPPRSNQKSNKRSSNNVSNLRGVKRLLQTPAKSKNDLTDVRGVKQLFKTCSPRNNLSNIGNIKNLFNQKSPKNDLLNISGIESVFRENIQTSTENDSLNISGGKLFRTTRSHKSPENNTVNFAGMKKLFKETKRQNPPKDDLTDVAGVKELFKKKSPRNDLMNITGVKNIFKEMKLQGSPKNDLSNVNGVKQLFRTTRSQKSPQNNLMNITGVKNIFKETKPQASPKNDLSNVDGVKQLFRTTRSLKSPQNISMNISGIENIFRETTLQNSQNVRNMKKSSKNSRSNKSPRNNLTNITGIKEMFNESKSNSPRNDPRNVGDVKEFSRLLDDIHKLMVSKGEKNTEIINRSTPKKKRNAQSLNSSKVVKKVHNRKSLRNSLLQISDCKANLINLDLKNSSSIHNNSKTNKTNKSPVSFLKNGSGEVTPKSENFPTNQIHGDDATPSSCVLENVGLVPTNLYKIKTETTNIRSRRQATINKTSFSLELAKVNTSIKKEGKAVKNASPVIACHSTPFVNSKALIKGLSEVSPILMNNAAASTSRKTRNTIIKKNVKPQPKKIKLIVKEEIDIKAEDLGNGNIINHVGRQTRSGLRNVKKVEPVENHINNSPVKTEFSPIFTLNRPIKNNAIKKKVTFDLADDKDLDIPKAKKTTRSLRSTTTSTVVKSEPSSSSKAVKKHVPAKKATKEPVMTKVAVIAATSTITKAKNYKAASASEEKKPLKKDVIKSETKSSIANKAKASKTKKTLEKVIKPETKSSSTTKAKALKAKKVLGSPKKATTAGQKKSSPQKDKPKTSKVKSDNAKKTKVTKISTKVKKATVKK